MPAQRAFSWAAVRLLALFAATFYLSDALAGLRASRFRVHMSWELAIPFWPQAFVVYFSVLAVPFLPLLLVPNVVAVQRWERRMAVTVLAATAVFLLFPAELAYVHGSAGGWWPLAALAHGVSGQYNLLPSLHVALSAVTLHAVWPWSGSLLRAVLALWFVLLVASVLLTHQHHVADVLAGALLAWGVCRLVTGPGEAAEDAGAEVEEDGTKLRRRLRQGASGAGCTSAS